MYFFWSESEILVGIFDCFGLCVLILVDKTFDAFIRINVAFQHHFTLCSIWYDDILNALSWICTFFAHTCQWNVITFNFWWFKISIFPAWSGFWCENDLTVWTQLHQPRLEFVEYKALDGVSNTTTHDGKNTFKTQINRLAHNQTLGRNS